MQKLSALDYLAGVESTEKTQASAPTNLHMITGEVASKSEDGLARILMDGTVHSQDDSQEISIEALGGLEEGDIVTILLSGEQGHGMTPLALGSVGSIDRIVTNVSEIQADYVKATELEADVAEFGYAHITDGVIDNATIDVADINDFSAEVADIADAQIANATIEQAQVRNLSVDYASTDSLEAAEARIGTLETTALTANSATIQNLEADTAKIHNLTANQISAATGYVGALTASNVTAQNIISDHGDFSTVKANAAKVANLTAQELEADHATIGTLDATYAQIDMANVNNGWITNGTIKNAAIKSQMVESISASQLTAGTIDADEITVQNLKASSLTVQTADGYVYVGEKRIPTKEFLDSLKDELQAEIDGAIETFTVSAIPTLNNTPANEWVVSGDTEATRKLRAKHVGDIAYVINAGSSANGHCYRFAYDNTTQTFGWVLIQDSDVTSALSRISNLETFESNTTSWIEETDEGLTTIRQNHTTLSGKVDKTVVETKQLWYTKSNTTAPGKPTAEVTSTSTSGNAWRVVVPAYSTSYPNYYYCLQYKLADGTFAWSDVVRDIAMGESQHQGRKGVSDAATAQTTANNAATAASTADGKAVAAQTTANSNIKSSVQLWFTKANTTAPNKPTAQVTTNSASTVNAWNLAIPTYNSSYPNYFSCYQQQKGDGTWQWTDVVFDRSITEAQAKAQAALPSSEFTTFQSTTFKNLVDEVDEQSSTITNLTTTVSNKADSSTVTTLSNTVNSVSQTTNSNSQYIANLTTTLGTNADGTSKSEDIVHKYNQLDQTLTGTISRVGETEASLITISNQNLSPFYSHPLDDINNATENPNGYWGSNQTVSGCTSLADGWTHCEKTNTASSTAWLQVYESAAWRNAHGGLKGDTKYTVLLEFKNVTKSGNVLATGITMHATSNPSMFVDNTTSMPVINGVQYHVGTTVSDTTASNIKVSTRTLISLPAGASISCDFRVSLYEGEYDGPYKPYVDQSLTTRMSSAETSISQNATDIVLRATKEESYQMGQPNLVPWFSAGVPQLPSTYWKYAAGSASSLPSSLQMTDMGDGWCRIVIDNTSGTGTVRYDYDPVMAEGIELGKDYTFLFEFRNIGQATSNSTQVYAVQAGTYGMQFWGNYAQKVLQGTSTDCTIVLKTTVEQSGNYVAELCDDGIYRKRIVRKSEASDSQYWTRSSDKRCVRLNAYCAAGDTFDAEFRFSIYEGEYTGPYKPYSGTKLYASQAELKVANDNINLRVEKNDVINQINLSTEGATISASKVNIEGAAIFTSGRLSDSSLASVRLTLTRNNWTDAGWATYETIGNNANWKNYHIATGGTTSATGFASNTLRVGDLVVVEGVSTDTGNTHRVTVKVTQVPSGAGSDIPGTTVNAVNSNSIADNIHVGGTNLLLGTQDWSSATKPSSGVMDGTKDGCSVLKVTSSTASVDTTFNSKFTSDIEADTYYTLSFWAKASAETGCWCFWYSPSNNVDGATNQDGNTSTRDDGGIRNQITTAWKRFYVTWHTKATSTEFPMKVIPVRLDANANVSVWMAGCKFEKGNKPTDWTPAPEDVAADISAVSTVANNAAPKTNAVKRTQRIYYRSSSDSKPTNMPSAWVTETGNKWSANNTTASNWTTKVTPISNGTGSSVTKYLYLWTCEQYELASGTVGYTNVLLDDATTVIDGGKIITGSVTANQLSANAVTAEKIAAGAITIGSVDGLQSALNGKETAGLVGIRLTLMRDNWTDAGWASREVSGYTGNYTNAHTAKGGSTSATGFASNTLRVNDLVIIEGISTDTGNTHRFTIRVTSVPANATAMIPGETVSSVNSVTMLDNINVGARNLLRWTNTQVDGDTWNKAADVSGTYGWYRYTSAITESITNDGMKFAHSSASTRSGIVMYLSEPNAVVGEENVILSFDYRTNMTTLYSPYLLVAESGNSQHSTSMTCTKSETNWVHGSWKLNFPSTEGKTVVALLFAYVNTNGGWIEIKRGTLKLEKGSKETDWTPAIEDLTVLSEYNNLLLDTDTWGDKLWYDSAGADISGDTVTYAANNTGNRMALIPCSSGQIFTLSYDIKASANITYGDSGGSILVDFVSSTTTYNRVSYFTPAKNSSVETDWKRVAYTFAVPYNDTIKALTVGLRNMSPSASCTLYFRHVKLAIGDKTTEWSPANEQSVKRTQRIYYRTSSDTRPTEAATPTTWVTQNGNKWSATNTSLVNWTTKVTPISDGTGSNVTKCLYLWTCQQFEFVDGTVSHSPVLLDDSTTVIDGAKIITGSVSANSLNADEVKAQIVQTTNLSADKITSGDISADRIKTNVISAINSLTAGTINGARINAEQIQIGGSSLATQSDINNIQVGVTNLLKKSHNINLCFNSTSKVASIEGGKSDPDGGSNAYLITPTSGQTGWYAGPSSANCILKNLEVSYTFSVWLRADTATQCKLCCRYMDSTPYSSTATRAVMNITTSWQRFYISAPLKQAQATDSVWIGQVTDTPIYVYHPKVEVGTKPSDWSPAPEDVDASIDSVQSDLDMSRNWYAECPTAAATTEKVATITPATTSFTTETLTPGTIVHVKFSVTNSGSAGSLKLNVNGTGAKPIKYIASGGNVANIPGNGYLMKGITYEFYYDGTNWVVQMPYNTNNYDRENYKAAVVASAAISSGRIAVFGTDHKLKTLAASAFDVSCPILYVATEYKAEDVTNGTARSTNYTFWGSTFTLTNTHSIQGAAAGLPVFIVGTLSGTTFTPNSTVLTCTVPTRVNNLVYLRLGLMSTATAAVLESDHPMYMFFDGKFQQCDPATASAACSATNHISMTGSGIKIANANPSTATTYQLQTSTGTDFVVAGSVMNRINGNGMVLYDGSGTDEDENVVAKFAGNLIELGKNRENTVIRCAENLELSYYHDNNGVRYGNLYSEAQIRMWSGYEDSSVPINQHAEVSAYAQQGEYQAMLKSVKMSQSANTSNKVASIASVVGDSGNSRIEARINDDPNDSNGSFIFDKNGLTLNGGPVLGSNGTGFTINGGTPIKAFYAGTDVFTLSNGQWMQLKSAQQVSTLLGSGASLANTICIAQNGDFNTYAGIVTGAMGQDGSARAYIYPNRTGSIRINYILIRFA